jgi:hypothetical protein
MGIVPRIVEIFLVHEGKVFVTFSDDQVAVFEQGHIYALAHNLEVLTSSILEKDWA